MKIRKMSLMPKRILVKDLLYVTGLQGSRLKTTFCWNLTLAMKFLKSDNCQLSLMPTYSF